MSHESTHAGGHSLGGPRASHFHLPFQLLLGIIFLISGGLLILKKFGFDFLSFIPEDLLIYISIVGSFLGGIHLIISKLWKPRLYL